LQPDHGFFWLLLRLIRIVSFIKALKPKLSDPIRDLT